RELTQSPEVQEKGLVLCNQFSQSSLGSRYPQIATLLGLRVNHPNLGGWVLALNKKDTAVHPAGGEQRALFCPSHATLLTPFVGLLDLHLRASQRYSEVREMLVGLTRSLTSAIDAKDAYTFGHSERVARIAVELGREMSLREEELSNIYLGGLLHDIGKIGVRDAILSKR